MLHLGRKTRSASKVEDFSQSTPFKLPNLRAKVACQHCGKLLLEKSLPGHIARLHKEETEEDETRAKRVLQSPKTPNLQMKRLKNNRHLTPQHSLHAQINRLRRGPR